MLLSIVIPTYNRASVLKGLLDWLAEQTDPKFQVVVAIDGATDNTEQMLQHARPPYDLKWVNTHCAGYGLAVARNQGILAADGDVIALIDDDCFPTPGFVAAHKRGASHQVITGGLRTPGDPSDERQSQKMRELDRLPDCQLLTFETLQREFPKAVTTECNICLLRQDFIDMGLFSERLKTYGFIGQEFFARARHLGYSYQYNRAAEVVHRRQKDGDNELNSSKKKREIMMSKALLPSFMTPAQYDKQISWAKDMQEAYPEQCPLPPFPPAALGLFPYRFLRNRAGDIKRRFRRKLVTVA